MSCSGAKHGESCAKPGLRRVPGMPRTLKAALALVPGGPRLRLRI